MSILIEDWVRPGARRLLKQLDNPVKFLMSPLPLYVWSNSRSMVSRLVEKMDWWQLWAI